MSAQTKTQALARILNVAGYICENLDWMHAAKIEEQNLSVTGFQYANLVQMLRKSWDDGIEYVFDFHTDEDVLAVMNIGAEALNQAQDMADNWETFII